MVGWLGIELWTEAQGIATKRTTIKKEKEKEEERISLINKTSFTICSVLLKCPNVFEGQIPQNKTKQKERNEERKKERKKEERKKKQPHPPFNSRTT